MRMIYSKKPVSCDFLIIIILHVPQIFAHDSDSKILNEVNNTDFMLHSFRPRFNSPVENLTVAVGREATFSCSISNVGKYKVGWLRASDKMIISLHTRTVIQNERIIVKYEKTKMENEDCFLNNKTNCQYSPTTNMTGTWHLLIRNLKESDRGCYMCQINTSPMISQVGCLDILVSPDILNNETSADVSVIEGENATLICRATGKPLPRITWRREDGKPIWLRSNAYSNSIFYPITYYNSSRLTFHRTDRRQMGAYLCIASNDVHPAVSKRITLSINFLPSVQAVNQLLGAPEGTDVTLECSVEANPNAVNYWIKNPNKMLLEGPKYLIKEKREEYKVNMILIIKKFRKDDIGSYSCISSNSLGKVEGVSRLYKIDDFSTHQISHASHHYPAFSGLPGSASDFRIKNIIPVKNRENCTTFIVILLCVVLLNAIIT